ncbi:TetR/AcrR family transcriptional regulator [Microbacterium sp. MPKO10]|uniref:TetR/AcrR family transcriptional regulator n=1 Tax=Microbacterium sp. MPKO10 TaxID=2989818 RepID=UPI002235965A|nr:TetR family transcriptional regulator [Microbacterium sp. MPKO10]MCW4457073.1 TetR family transcriptional regulator [Microbacterium sp. MPKO10]
MSTRHVEVLDAAIRVIASSGMHGLTHRTVDRAAGVPEGSTSNVFRTRSSLVAGVATHIANHRLAAGSAMSPDVSLAWFELLIEARRNADVATAIASLRAQMIDRLGTERSDQLPLTNNELAALLTGLEFAETVTGEQVMTRVFERLDRDTESPSQRNT